MKFTATPEQYAAAHEQYKSEVRPRVDEEVEAVALFRRTGAAASMAVSKARLGAVAYAGVKLFNKKKAGGLPERVLLAVTPTKLYAFKGKIRGSAIKAGDEVAVWERAALRVGTDKSMKMTQLTLESPAEGERVTLVGGGIADDPLSQEVMRLLTESAAGPPQG